MHGLLLPLAATPFQWDAFAAQNPVLSVVLVTLLKLLGFVFMFVMGVATVLTWAERKFSALMQNRVGPNRANIGKIRLGGLLHMIADPIKMLTKEDFVPDTPNPWLFRLAPLIAFVPALLVFVAVPFGPRLSPTADLQIAPSLLGILFIFAIASLNVYGAVIGAWASNNKWSLMGGLRISAQMISYEVAIGLSLCGVFLIYGSLDLQEITYAQAGTWWGLVPRWGIFAQPLAFILYLACAMAENKRAPFDVAEAESELAAGYWTEYSAMGWAVLALAEFVEVVLIGCLGTTLFLGGWQIPYSEWLQAHHLLPQGGWQLAGAQVTAFLVKVILLILLQMAIRWTLPRFRYDQVMRLGWRIMLPLALANLVVTGIVVTLSDRL